MPEMIYDAIIAGAGPAGASAAYTLGQAGCKVLILDKKQLPRHKTCGGGVSTAFLKSFFPFSCEPVVERQVSQIEYQFLGFSVEVPCQAGVMGMVMRDRLDYHLLNHCKAEIRDKVSLRSFEEKENTVQVKLDNGETCSGRYLIGADGANAITARTLLSGTGKKRTFIPAIEVETHLPDQVFEKFIRGPRFIFEGPRFGYGWIFPKSDHLTIGVAALRPKRGALRQELSRIIKDCGVQPEKIHFEGHPIPLYHPHIPIATRRVLLAGDAAGLVDPLSGEGIRPALKSGRIAAETILAGTPEVYASRIRRTVAQSYPFSKGIGNFFFSLRELCLLFGAPNPYTTQAILDTISDHGSSIGILLQALATLPYYLMFEVAALLIGSLKGQASQMRFLNTVYPGKYLPESDPAIPKSSL